MSAALARVRCVVAAGRRVADASDPLGREARERLPAATALAPESVEVALRDHLETNPSHQDLATLVARAASGATTPPPAPESSPAHPAPSATASEPTLAAPTTRPPRCHVVLSANVCTAALRALALAVATSPAVLVKPSRRDPVLAELLVRALTADPAFAAAAGTIALVPAIAPAPGDEVHVYATDETIRAIAATLPPGASLRSHGTGFGVALVEAGADIPEAASALALDVAAFDQRGCLSPRVLLVRGDAPRAATFARALACELDHLARRRPRGPLDATTRAELRTYVATTQALGACHEGEGFVVGLDESPTALVLPPAARAVHVVPATLATTTALLTPWARWIAAIGAADHGPLLDAARALAPRARTSALGAMQRPPLDGPVDLRALAPLTLTPR